MARIEICRITKVRFLHTKFNGNTFGSACIASSIFLLTLCCCHSFCKDSPVKKDIDEINSKFSRNNPQAVLPLVEKALKKGPNTSELSLLLLRKGQAYSLMHRRAQAIAEFTESIKVQPSSAAYRERSYLYKVLSEADKALYDIQQAYKLEPNAEHMLLSAKIRFDLEDLPHCIADAKKALSLLNTEPPSRRQNTEMNCYQVLGLAELASNQPAKALHYFDKSLTAIPGWTLACKSKNKQMMMKVILDVPEMLFLRGEAFEKLGKWKEAIADYELTAQISQQKFDYQKSLLRVYMKANESQKALALLNKLLQTDDSPFLYYKRGEVYKRLGKTELSRKDLERAKRSEDGIMNNTKFVDD